MMHFFSSKFGRRKKNDISESIKKLNKLFALDSCHDHRRVENVEIEIKYLK